MKYQCTRLTDLDELIGHDESDGFHTGPLYAAMKSDQPLELMDSANMTLSVQVKLRSVSSTGIFVPETGERIDPPDHFSLLFR